MVEPVRLHDLDQAVSASQQAFDRHEGGGFMDRNGEDVRPPDRIEYRFGARRGRLVAVFHDGDAYVRFDDDFGDTLVKWCHLCKVPAWVEAFSLAPPVGGAVTPGVSRPNEDERP